MDTANRPRLPRPRHSVDYFQFLRLILNNSFDLDSLSAGFSQVREFRSYDSAGRRDVSPFIVSLRAQRGNLPQFSRK